MNIRKSLVLAVSCVASWIGTTGSYAQSVSKPVFYPYTFSDDAILTAMSKNGKWGLAKEGSSEVETGSAPKLVNLETQEVITIEADTAISCDVNAVTNDGSIVVGSYNGMPAYWNRETGQWTQLQMQTGWTAGGYVNDVTPDGKRAVGVLNNADNIYQEKPAAWDLTTGKRLTLGGLPKKDMQHSNENQCRFTAITPDGRYAMGCMSFSYIMPAQLFEFVYDLEEDEYTVVGFDEDETADWTPHWDDLYYIDGGYFSPNGQWATGMAYIAQLQNNSSAVNEYDAAYCYNVETGELTVLNQKESDMGYMGVSIDNDGVVYAATPTGDPIRDFYVRSGNYWFSFEEILKQYFGVDFAEVTGYDNTGTPLAVSEDGRRILSMVDPRGSSYVVDLPVSLVEACKHINLLSSYSVSPASGAIFSRVHYIDVTFDRDIEVMKKDDATVAVLKDSEGNVCRNSNMFEVDGSGKTLNIGFRSYTMEEGKTYTVTIPAGALCVAGDTERTNEEIVLTYTGRKNQSVAVTNIYPADGTKLPKLDASESPILLTFDALVALPDTAAAYLYRDDQTAPVATLTLAYADQRVAVYPTNTQYLYAGSTYRVVVPAGSVTDLVGENGCAEIVLNYEGTYERTISQTDGYLFKWDFDDMSNSLATFMLYEGDHNTPQSDLIDYYEFDADNTPWNFSLRGSSTSTDYCAASHSMYTNGGRSDDWMAIPQIYLPDATCQLFFDAQSFKKSAEDTLTVVVWPCEEVYNVLTDDIVARMKSEGTVVFHDRLSPGSDEEELDDDWTNYYVSLKDFAGKSVYIAFVNQNQGGSIVFVDNVKVMRDMKFSIALKNDAVVVAQTEEVISGTITIESQEDVYSSYSLILKDGNGNEVDRIVAAGLSLKKEDKIPFQFAKPLPLTLAEMNTFTIEVSLDDYTEVVKSTVQNNAFRPTKRVVLEEFTGVTCGNCPLGILAIENLEKAVGSQFIPISLHGYSGDPWATAVSGYASYLGFSAAPSGMIQRSGTISSPMYAGTDDYYFSSPQGDVWYDLVMAELEELALADVSATCYLDTVAGRYTIPVTVKYALNASDLNFNLFTVLMEDNNTYFQENYFAAQTFPTLGEFAKGGKYGSTYAVLQHNDVVRSVVGLSYAGTGGMLPQTMTAGEEYTATIYANLPSSVSKVQNTKAAILLIDANTGAIVNACVAPVSFDSASGIESVAVGSVKAVEVYNLSGQRVATASSFEAAQRGLQSGVYVVRTTGTQGTASQKILVR